jgi:HPt (histidine-containing phosphotransfer) domain-containing protein
MNANIEEAEVESRLGAVTRNFARSLPARIETLRRAWRAAPPDLKGLRDAAHQLAGTAPCFGFRELGGHAAKVEAIVDVLLTERRAPTRDEAAAVDGLLGSLLDEAANSVERRADA